MKRWILLTISLGAATLALATAWGGQEPPPPEDAEAAATANAKRALWRSSIEPPKGKEAAGALDDSIRRLRSYTSAAVPEPAGRRTPEGQGPSAPRATTLPAGKPTTRPAGISPELIAKLKDLGPERVAHSAAVGDALYTGGNLTQAAVFYEMALQAEETPQERAWLLFQLANCRREASPLAALGVYGKLLSEQPDSLWSELGGIQRELVKWMRSEELTEALEEVAKYQE